MQYIKQASVITNQVARIISGFFVLKIIIINFSVSEIAKFGQLLTFTAYLTMLSTVIFTRYAINASANDEAESFGNINFIATLFSIILAIPIFILSDYISLYLIGNVGLGLYLKGISLVLPLLSFSLLFQAFLSNKKIGHVINFSQAASTILSFVIIYFCVKNFKSLEIVYLYPLLLVLMNFIACLLIYIFFCDFNIFHIKNLLIINQFKKILYVSAPMIISVIMGMYWSTFIRFNIINDAPPLEAASWEIIRRISDSVMQICGAAMLYIYYPYILENHNLSYKKKLNALVPVLGFIVVISVFLIFAGHWGVSYISSEIISKFSLKYIFITLAADFIRILFFAIQLEFLSKKQSRFFVLFEMIWVSLLVGPYYLYDVNSVQGGTLSYLFTQLAALVLILFVRNKYLLRVNSE